MSNNFNKAALSVLGGIILFGAANAQSITAIYTGQYGTPGVTFTTALPGHTGTRNDPTTLFNGTRTDVAGPGIDTAVGHNFKSFCVEIGEYLHFNQNETHAQVVPLAGNNTISGGISGPVTFDPVRAQRLQTLWGSFYGAINNANKMSAFQLAQWELAFDDDATLVQASGSKLWVATGQFQANITDQAENWLTQIRTGAATQQMGLLLMRGNGIQDQITPMGSPVPEPASIAALGLGVTALIRRRKAARS